MDSEVVKLEDFLYGILLSVALYIFFALDKLICTLVETWLDRRRRRRRPSILLLGLSDSGKTLLLQRLKFGYYMETFTSMEEHSENYVTPKNTYIQIVDIPGQERLRNKFFDEYKSCCKAIIYVIDSVNIQEEIRDVAEYLYTILSDPIIQRNCPPVLIVCNKQDQPLAMGRQVIKNFLEMELNLVRVRKSLYLGTPGKDFEVSDLACRVDIVECSATTGNDDASIPSVDNWIIKLYTEKKILDFK